MKLIYDGREIETGGGGLTQKEADGRYLQLAGGTIPPTEEFRLETVISDEGMKTGLNINDGTVFAGSISETAEVSLDISGGDIYLTNSRTESGEKILDTNIIIGQYDVDIRTTSSDGSGSAIIVGMGEIRFSNMAGDAEESVSLSTDGLNVSKCVEPNSDTMPATKGYVDRAISESGGSVSGDGNPLGTVISFMGTKAPNGYLVCDGALYSVNDYPALAAFFSEQFGAANHFGGDGETTFAVPDLRNQFLRGFHGDSPEKLSGEIGALQKGTEIPYLYSARNESGSGGVIFPIPTENYTSQLKNPDFQTEKPPTYAGIWPSSISNNINIIKSYGARPVNMAVLFCIKSL